MGQPLWRMTGANVLASRPHAYLIYFSGLKSFLHFSGSINFKSCSNNSYTGSFFRVHLQWCVLLIIHRWLTLIVWHLFTNKLSWRLTIICGTLKSNKAVDKFHAEFLLEVEVNKPTSLFPSWTSRLHLVKYYFFCFTARYFLVVGLYILKMW